MFDKNYNQQLIINIKNLIKVKNKPIYFPKPIIVKTTPHTEIFRCYGIIITMDDELKLMDPAQEWAEIKPEDKNAGYVLQTIFQRLKGQLIEDKIK